MPRSTGASPASSSVPAGEKSFGDRVAEHRRPLAAAGGLALRRRRDRRRGRPRHGGRREVTDELVLFPQPDVPCAHRALDAGGSRRTLHRATAEPGKERAQVAGVPGGQPDGEAARAPARRHRRHGDGGDLRLSRRSVPGARTRAAAGRPSARRLPAMDVLRGRVRRARDRRSHDDAAGSRAPFGARLRQLRRRVPHAARRDRKRRFPARRPLHRRRPLSRLATRVRHDGRRGRGRRPGSAPT